MNVHSVSDLPSHVTELRKKKDISVSVGVRAVMGKQQLDSEPTPVCGDSAHLSQSLQIPIMWPSVARTLSLQLLAPALGDAFVVVKTASQMTVLMNREAKLFHEKLQ